MMRLPFWKMHGIGNDYILIDNRDGGIDDSILSSLAQRLCRRRFSVGADGLLLLYNSNVADARMRIFNADGSEAEMCGNGIRCLARYCYEKGIVRKSEMSIETIAGIKGVWLHIINGKVSSITVDMGSPIFDGEKIPILGKKKFINEWLDVDGRRFRATCLSVGNPHCVIFVEDVASFPVEYYGPKIERHPLFPKRTNIEFIQIIRPDMIKVRVWERGVGETLACGTGACASVVVGRILGTLDDECVAQLPGGNLKIKYDETSNKIFLTGPAEKVYEGVIELEDFV